LNTITKTTDILEADCLLNMTELMIQEPDK